MIRRIFMGLIAASAAMLLVVTPAMASSQAKSQTLPGGLGKITSNAWRTTGDGSLSGNTRQWDYQVSAVYEGSQTVQRIRATWWGGASLRNGASISLGLSGSGVSVGFGSNWQYVETVHKYWENTNGAKTSSWRSNMIVAPEGDYRNSTIFIANEALVKVKNDARTFQITASA